jgi:thioredoxin-related protein
LRRALFILSALLVVSGVAGVASASFVPRGPAPSLTARDVVPAKAEAAALIMVDDPACGYCVRWNKEVGRGYARTAEGRAAPLRRVRRDSRALADFAPVIYTPTFILVRGGREVGRITGYPGQLYFWEELSNLMSSAGIKTSG